MHSDAVASLLMNLPESPDGRTYRMSDIFDEKEIKTCDPAPQTEVEAGCLAQDVTLESEIWTFDEVEWHETAQDTTTIKYVPVQVRPAVAKLRERVAKAATEETRPQQVRAWKLFLSLDKMLFHTSDAKRTNNTSLTKAIRTRIAQIEAGNALEILRPSRQTYVHQRTTKPRTDPTDATDKHNQRTIQLINSAVEDVDGRRAGNLVKGISGMAPAADVKRNWSKLYPEPKTQSGNTETLPFTEEDKQSFLCQLLLAIKFSPSHRATGPVGSKYEQWAWMTEFDGDPCHCVWEAFWGLATADVPTEILGTYLAARIVPATKPNGAVSPFAIGQVIRRLVCKATAKLLTKKVRSITSPQQFAMKQGPELLHKIVSAHVAIHRDVAMASVWRLNGEPSKVRSKPQPKTFGNGAPSSSKLGTSSRATSTTVISSPTERKGVWPRDAPCRASPSP